MHVIFVGIPWKPPMGSFAFDTSGGTLTTLTCTGFRPDWRLHLDGEQILCA